jgi:hypothetical protein
MKLAENTFTHALNAGDKQVGEYTRGWIRRRSEKVALASYSKPSKKCAPFGPKIACCPFVYPYTILSMVA